MTTCAAEVSEGLINRESRVSFKGSISAGAQVHTVKESFHPACTHPVPTVSTNSSLFKRSCQNVKKRNTFLSRNRSRPDVDLAVKSNVWFLSFEFDVWLVRAWCVRVPGMASGCTEVLKDMVAGWDLPLWFSATTWTSYSVSHSSPLRTTYSLLLGIRISGFHSEDWSFREIRRGVIIIIDRLLRWPRCPPHTHWLISDQVM